MVYAINKPIISNTAVMNIGDVKNDVMAFINPLIGDELSVVSDTSTIDEYFSPL